MDGKAEKSTKDISISKSTHERLKDLKIGNDTFDTVISMLLSVFQDPSIKEIYKKRRITEEYYEKAVAQRRLEYQGFLDKIKEEDIKDTGTRPFQGEYLDNEVLDPAVLNSKVQSPAYPHKNPYFTFKKHDYHFTKIRKKYVNRFVLNVNDYDLESIAHLQYMTGLKTPKEIVLLCIRFAYMVFSQDRLVRNTNAELAEKNLNHMIQNSVLNKDPIIPIYNYDVPSMGKDILKKLRSFYEVKSNQQLLRRLVFDAYEEHEDDILFEEEEYNDNPFSYKKRKKKTEKGVSED